MRVRVEIWQFYVRYLIRWRNEVVGGRRIRAVMELRRREFAASQVPTGWLTDEYIEQAYQIVAGTRSRYPWAADAKAWTYIAPGQFLGPSPWADMSKYSTLQAGLNVAAGGVAYFPPGFAPKTNATANIPSGTTLHFAGTVITLTASLGGGLFNVNNPDITIEGEYSVVGAGFTTDIFFASSGTNRRLRHDAIVKVAALAVASLLFNLTFSTNLVIKGLITSTDCKIVQTRGCQYQDISGIQAGPYTRSLGAFSPVSVIDNGNTFPPIQSTLHNIIVDGGGFLAFAHVEVAQRQGGFTHGSQAVITDLLLLAGGAAADGLDVVQMDQVSLVNVNVKNAGLNGINCSGNVQVTGSGGSAIGCGAAGLQMGDNTVAFQTNLQSWTGFIAIDCGIAGQVDFTACGILLFAPAASSTNIITLTNCQSYESAQVNMKYGLGIGNGVGGTFSQIYIIGGFYHGATAPYLDSSTVKVAIYRDCPQITPQGASANVPTPAFPASTVVVTNTTGFDVMAYVTNGNTAMTLIQINGQNISGSLPANAVDAYFIPAGGTITFVYAAGAPGWFWFGM